MTNVNCVANPSATGRKYVGAGIRSILFASAATLSIAAGWAQENPSAGASSADAADAAEIIVTARKREESLQDTSAALSVVDDKLLEKRRVSDVNGLQGVIPTLKEYVARYCERTGFRIEAGDIGFYSAFNLFRVAAILQGVAGRIRDGIVTAKNAAQIVMRIEPIANAAWAEAQRAEAG